MSIFELNSVCAYVKATDAARESDRRTATRRSSFTPRRPEATLFAMAAEITRRMLARSVASTAYWRQAATHPTYVASQQFWPDADNWARLCRAARWSARFSGLCRAALRRNPSIDGEALQQIFESCDEAIPSRDRTSCSRSFAGSGFRKSASTSSTTVA